MNRLQLTGSASKVLEKIGTEFRKRKIPQQDWYKIFCEAITAHGQDFWEAQLEKHTPDSYVVERALQDPKMQKEIREFLQSRMDQTREIGQLSDAANPCRE